MSDVVVLTGAGVSAESGLGTFRDLGGIWGQVRLEDVATPEAFARDPGRVHAFYNARRAQAARAAPNPAHRALARLQSAWPRRVVLVTQNIDDLHERGGADSVIHMHGSVFRALCVSCGARADWRGNLATGDTCPACGAVGHLRPDVVWFGEMPYHLDEIEEALAQAALFIAIGTSGTVYPAAGFADLARSAGADTVELNLEPTGNPAFATARAGRASELVPEFVASMLATSAGRANL